MLYSCVPLSEPEGISAPEVVPVNSSTARVLWFLPLRPNGAVTVYNIYVNDHLHGSVDNSSGSYLLVDLQPFTVYNIQVHMQSKANIQTLIYKHEQCVIVLCVDVCVSGGSVHSVRLCSK